MNTLLDFGAGETLLVIGLGRSGIASTQVLRGRGARIYVTDEKAPEELAAAIAQIDALGAVFTPPAQLHAVLPELRAAVLSPGVPLNGALVRRVQDANIPVFSEIEVASRLCKAPIVAVTGTKGKSTTTALIGHLLRECGERVHVGGNIGNPLILEVLDAAADDIVVAEVSSFQLESIRSFRPRVSVLLNISADHLDRYYSMDEYTEAKFRIFANQNERDFFVGNLDDERVRQLHWHTGESRVHARQLWFTMDAENHKYATMYPHGKSILYSPIAGDPRPVEIVRIDEITLAGRHNVQNVMAALLASIAAGANPERLRDAVKSFTAMAHRLQPVAEIGGIRFVDDSKATNPGAVIAALQAFSAPIVLIAGGKSKNTDFTELGRAIDEHAKALVLIGEAADEIAAHVHRAPIDRAGSLQDAVRRAQALAQAGDVVLLSPACASFDMFKSAEDRGEQFTAAVQALAEPAAR